MLRCLEDRWRVCACSLLQSSLDEIAVGAIAYHGDCTGPFVKHEPGLVEPPQALLPEGGLHVFGQAADP